MELAKIKVSIDGLTFDGAQARVSVLDRGFLYGDSVFEVGGKNKRGSQLPKTSQSEYVVKDDILVGSKRVIPIHLFGFLY